MIKKAFEKLEIRRFWRLFRPFFTLVSGGHIRKLLLHRKKKEKNRTNQSFITAYKTYIFYLCPLLCWGDIAKWQAQSEEEALFINRVADFWEEGEYQIAKNQMEEFLATYPNSVFADSLYAALGDLSLREKKPSNALECYAKIKDPEIASGIQLHRLQCLYSMQWYAILADECQDHLESTTDPSDDRMQITYYLAIALYHQCLNAAKEPELLQQLAYRAQPYFETLLESSLNHEVAAAFAHLCCILKDFPKAASIYLDLAKNENKEEMLFQAALIQAEYDKELAIQTFEEIISLNGSKENEAAYNYLVLSFDIKRYEALLENKDVLLSKIPSDRIDMAHLYFGRSLLSLQKGQEACSELRLFLLDDSHPKDKETMRSALTALLEASFVGQDLDSFNSTLTQLESLYPNSEDSLKGKLLKARLWQQKNQISEAQQELKELLTQITDENLPLKQQVLLELTYVNNQMNNWEDSRNSAIQFLSQFPEHPEASKIEHALISATTELVNQGLLEKDQLLFSLQALLNKAEKLPSETRMFWEFLMAKTLVALQQHQKALPILQQLVDPPITINDPIHLANIQLLLAICYREGFQDLEKFCTYTENVFPLLQDGKEQSFDKGSLHASLYNAYLERSISDTTMLNKAEVHLYEAFIAKTPIETENLLWLANRFAKDANHEKKTVTILEHIKQQTIQERELIQVCKVYIEINKSSEAIVILENLAQQPEQAFPKETALLLGELYSANGMQEEALDLFDSITREKSSLKTEIGASAYLQSARLRTNKWINAVPSADDPEFQQVLMQLKDLVLQKKLNFEPLYLEAALDYIDLQDRCYASLTKKLSLLQKTKQDFESTEDLLSKDYHRARKEMSEKDRIYQSYITLLESEILSIQSQLNLDEIAQKELQAKAKDLLLKIVEEQVHPALVARANKCLSIK